MPRRRRRRVPASSLDFAAADAAAKRFTAAAEAVKQKQDHPDGNETALNTALRATEGDLLSPEGLPNRPWFKHTIYAPGEYTGYAAVVIPGVNEAIDAKDAQRGQAQLGGGDGGAESGGGNSGGGGKVGFPS